MCAVSFCQDGRIQDLRLALDCASERLGTAEAAAEALRQREATLRTELRAVRAVRDRPLAHGTLPSLHTGGRSTEFRDGGKDTMQVLFTKRTNRGLILVAPTSSRVATHWHISRRVCLWPGPGMSCVTYACPSLSLSVHLMLHHTSRRTG